MTNWKGKAKMREHFLGMAAYNAWANERLYEAVKQLSEGQIKSNNGAYFGSLFGALTHILIADRIWMFRLTGEGPNPTNLREIPFETLGELWMERQLMDLRISSFVDSLNEDDLPEDVHYSNTRGEAHKLARQTILTHFFNHQTHHRGQVHHMLSVEGLDPPPLDLLYFVLPTA
ncbi:DinB family protein [Hyphobacterium sp.]|uniref:DinB family protein n=1 Tax=Hyphobacterium sp. TaxID=2004662 RepID=UPI003BA87759